MKIELSSIDHLAEIMQIIGDAQTYLASQNIDQWQDGYPTQELLLRDIENKESYIIKNDQTEVIGTVMFTTKGEPTYKNIEGDWLMPSDKDYGVIHRLAVREKFRKTGMSRFVFLYFENYLKSNGIPSMKVDTHPDNVVMQGLLKSLGFSYCGVIYLVSGAKRLGFEKIIQS